MRVYEDFCELATYTIESTSNITDSSCLTLKPKKTPFRNLPIVRDCLTSSCEADLFYATEILKTVEIPGFEFSLNSTCEKVGTARGNLNCDAILNTTIQPATTVSDSITDPILADATTTIETLKEQETTTQIGTAFPSTTESAVELPTELVSASTTAHTTVQIIGQTTEPHTVTTTVPTTEPTTAPTTERTMEPTTTPTPETTTELETVPTTPAFQCSNAIFECNMRPACAIHCDMNQGYYPDVSDCRNYCFCSGNVLSISRIDKCGPGTIWNPRCGSAGCCDFAWNTNTDHCLII